MHNRRRLLFLLFLLAVLAFHSLASARPPEPPASPPEDLVPGEALIRKLWRKNLVFSFEGTAGEVINLHVTSRTPGLDPNVVLMDPEDVEEVSDDDSGEHGNCLIKDHSLKQAGLYTVIVKSDGRVNGKVEVLLEKATPPEQP